jgi:hypothetical protein
LIKPLYFQHLQQVPGSLTDTREEVTKDVVVPQPETRDELVGYLYSGELGELLSVMEKNTGIKREYVSSLSLFRL